MPKVGYSEKERVTNQRGINCCGAGFDDKAGNTAHHGGADL